jgi:hypothetical protein
MACNRKTTALPLPCQALAAARAQMAALMSGQAIMAIETPQLGRVEFMQPPKVAELQAYIDSLAAQCAAAGGDPGANGGVRRPFSLETWP